MKKLRPSPSTSPWHGLDAELARLWAAGDSIAAIGKRLGVSRNAAVGRVHRLGLPPRSSPLGVRAPDAAPDRREVPLDVVPTLADLVREMEQPPMMAPPVAPPSPAKAPTPQPAPRTCLWPLWPHHLTHRQARDAGLTLWCGAPASGVYCAEHAAAGTTGGVRLAAPFQARGGW